MSRRWIADHDFGPYDGALQVGTWLARALIDHAIVPAM
jgi:hypothetical protein